MPGHDVGLAQDITTSVIASEAKQSTPRKESGLLRRFAPRNDETGERARHILSVIGLAEGETRWRCMTAERRSTTVETCSRAVQTKTRRIAPPRSNHVQRKTEGLFLFLLLAAQRLQLGEHGVDIEVVARFLRRLEFRLLPGGLGG